MKPFNIVDISKLSIYIDEVLNDICFLLDLCLKQSNIEPISPPINKENLSLNLVKLANQNRDNFSKFYDLADNTLPSLIALANNCKLIVPDGYKFLADYPLLRADLPVEYQKNNTPWHQEIMFYDYSSDSITIWIPLLPINQKTGSLQFYSGKISQNIIPADKYITKDSGPYIFVDEKYIRDMGDKIIEPVLKQDQALIFNNLALHRSAPNISRDMVRLTVQIRFHSVRTIFAGDKFKSPTLKSESPISIDALRKKRL